LKLFIWQHMHSCSQLPSCSQRAYFCSPQPHAHFMLRLCPLLPTETCYMEVDRSTGISAVTTPLDPRSAYFTTMRNVSQIENAVAHYEAMARGADLVRTDAGYYCCRAE
jgi:hypothetical protein